MARDIRASLRMNESSLFQRRDLRVYAISLRNGCPVNLYPFSLFPFILTYSVPLSSSICLSVCLSVSLSLCLPLFLSLSHAFVLHCHEWQIWEFELTRVVNCRSEKLFPFRGALLFREYKIGEIKSRKCYNDIYITCR